MSEMEDKMKDIVCLIKFITILDNTGKLIYGKYFNIPEADKQREFEKKLCLNVQNLGIPIGELDTFILDEYNVFVKIVGEIAYFIGLDENDNECLGYSFCKCFENTLMNITGDSLERVKILENYDKIIVMIDEMIDEGVVVNTDMESLDKLINNRDQSGGQFISFTADSNESSSSGGFFGSLLSGAKSIFG